MIKLSRIRANEANPIGQFADGPIHIRRDSIIGIFANAAGETVVATSGGPITVSESVTQVLKLVSPSKRKVRKS